MKTLTPIQSFEWLINCGFADSIQTEASLFSKLPPLNFMGFKYQFPKDSGKKVALARLIYGKVKSDPNTLIWVRNWNIWQSSSHVPLLLRLRQALGENRGLEETPGHIFSNDEKEDAVSVLVLSLEFFWDCLLVGSNNNFACFLSHDEFYMIISANKVMLDEIDQTLASGKWGVKL